jgi:hypothetical protein
MKREHFIALSSGLTLCILCAGSAIAVPRDNPPPAVASVPASTLQERAVQAYGALPLVFEENRGQAGAQVAFLAHADGYTFLFGRTEAVLERTGKDKSNAGLQLSWVGANPAVGVSGGGRLAAISNYFAGQNPGNWKTNIPNFARVEYGQLYPGINLAYYGNQRQLEYDLSVAPGADIRRAELALANASSVRLDKASGDLLVATSSGVTRMHKPVAYQGGGESRRRIVPAAYVLTPGRHVRFRIGPYDHSKQLVIDPVVVYGSYFGGTALNERQVMFLGIATDASGFIYVAGFQNEDSASALPTTSGSYRPSCVPDVGDSGFCLDYFIAKFDPTKSGASSLIYSTYIGTDGFPYNDANAAGYQDDFSTSRTFAVDSAGNAYLTGPTNDSAFPTTANALLRTCTPQVSNPNLCNTSMSFLTKLSPSGSTLLYSSYFGQPDSPTAYGIAVDNSGRAFVAGASALNGSLPVTNGGTCPSSFGVGLCEGWWVGAFDTTQSGAASLLYLQWLDSDPFGVATDGAGNAYVYGEAKSLASAVYAVPNGYQTVNGGGGAVTLLQKLNVSGVVTYGSFFQATTPFTGPGTGSDMHASAIAADSSGRAFITGFINPTGDNDIPLLNGLPVTTLPIEQYPYLAAFDTTQSGNASLLYSTLILPSTLSQSSDVAVVYPFGIATDGAGRVALTAYVGSGVQPSVSPTPSYPIVNPLADSAPGLQIAAVSLFDITKSGAASLLFSSPINGSANQAQQVAIDADDNVYIAGTTDYSTAAGLALPVTPNGYQTTAVTTDAYPYVLKIAPGASSTPPAVTITVAPTTITVGESATLTWSSTNATSCTASGAWSGTQDTSGTHSESPTAIGSNTYTLTCTGSGGSADASAALMVNAAAPTVILAVNPTSITVGQSATLTWSSTNSTSCTASGAWSGTQTTSGTHSESPANSGSTTYSLTCTGAGGSANASAILTASAAAPTVTLSVNPTSITAGQSATLTWSSTNATSCTASGSWSGTQETSGTLAVTPSVAGNSTYTLNCSGAGTATGTSVVHLTVTAQLATVTVLSGRAGGGSMGLWSLLGLGLLLAWRMRGMLSPTGFGTLAALAVVAVLAPAAPASAQQASSPVQFNWDQTYVGIRAGGTTYGESSRQLDADLVADGETGTSTSIDQHRAGGVVYAGVPFYKALSLELGFADLGVYHVGISTTSSNIPQLAQTIVRNLSPAGRALTLNLAAPLDINSWFAVEPRIGVMGYQSKQEVYAPLGTFSHDREGGGIDAGFAVLLRPTRSLSIGAGVDCFDTDSRCNVMLYSAEIEYHFGR